MKNKIVIMLFALMVMGFTSCDKKDDEVGTNDAPVVSFPDIIQFDLKDKPTLDDLKAKLSEYITDDYTAIQNIVIESTTDFNKINLKKEKTIEIKGKVIDDGTNSLGEKGEVKSTDFSFKLELFYSLKQKTLIFDAKEYTEWVYVSLDKGRILGVTEAGESRQGLDWDIAFHRYNVRLNCGKSGSGEGGAILMEGKVGQEGWDSVLEAPAKGYKVDETLQISLEHAGRQTYAGGSKVITGGMGTGTWVIFNHDVQQYVVTNQIFVIKTAKGKYAKIWLKGFVGDDNKGGHITMEYMLQRKNSRKFE